METVSKHVETAVASEQRLSQLIQDYMIEVHGKNGFDHNKNIEYYLQALISSHRRLRENATIEHDQRMKMISEERERAYESARQYAIENSWISVEKLSQMTMQQVADFLR